jgi:phosphatase NudJ
MPNMQLTHINAGVAIYQSGKFLLVQEKNPKCYGQWNWPAGHVDEGTTIEDSAIREVKEELGLVVELVGKVDIFEQKKNPYVPMHLFAGKILSGELSPAEDEILAAQWFTLEEIKNLETRDPWVLEGAKLIIDKHR